jgi:SnoaL-like domain
MTLSYEDERTLLSVAGRAAVQDLTIRQHRAFEQGDETTWLGTFVVAGALELPGLEPLVGHPALQRWFAAAARPAAVLLTDSVVRIDGVHGTQECRTLVSSDGSTADQIILGRVVPVLDEVIYERGRWYFARRRVQPPAG